MIPRALYCLPLACLFAGCAAGPTKTFDISVHNKSSMPVMIWLSKDGPPPEKGWMTTEQFLSAPPDTPSPGVTVPPDKTANTGKITGHFPKGTNAVLEIFGTDKTDPRTKAAGLVVIQLDPGRSDLTVTLDQAGHLTVTDTATGVVKPLFVQP
jgi:hypothetical protein